MRRDRTRRAIASKHVVNYTYLLPCGRQIIMDLALATLPVVTATVFATCAEAWVMADMISRYACDYVARPRRRARQGVVRAFVFVFVMYFIWDLLCIINYVSCM